MKKSILLLLVLLITLIGTCIYKKAYLPSLPPHVDKRHIVIKTHTLYPKEDTIATKEVVKEEPKPLVKIEPVQKQETMPHKEIPKKKEPIQEKKTIPTPTPKEVVEEEPKPLVKIKPLQKQETMPHKEIPKKKEPIQEKKTIPTAVYPTIQPMPLATLTPKKVVKEEHKPLIKIEPVQKQETMPHKEMPKKKEPIQEKKTIPTAVYPTIQPMPLATLTPKEVVKKEVKRITQEEAKSQTEQKMMGVTMLMQQQQEQIDVLLNALKNRNSAIKTREAFLDKIEDFIESSLTQRLKTITTMREHQINMDALREKIIETRDTIYKEITKTNTPTLGE